MRCQIRYVRAMLVLGAVSLTAYQAADVSAQQSSNSLFDADYYWNDYWNWYDTEYVPGYTLRGRTWGRAGYQGQSPAISGAPSAGGDYDDYPAEFYVPGGAGEFYGGPAVSPPPRPAAADLADPRTPITAQSRQPAPASLRDNDDSRLPPDLDRERPANPPVSEATPEIWY